MLKPVYDILNCGPRHRYSANGKLVHNSFKLNQQNLPRVSGKLSDALRNSIMAPPGFKLVVSDLSGIELRVNHFLWKTPYSIALWQNDAAADLYRAAGALWYKCAPEDITKAQRQLEKVKALGLGFGAGAATFRAVAKSLGGIILTAEESQEAVTAFREMHPEIVGGWKRCHAGLSAIAQGARKEIDPSGLVFTDAEGFVLPSGRKIRYPKLRQEPGDRGGAEWVYSEGRNKARIYAGKCDENIVQALARDVLSEIMISIKKETGYHPALHVHDELVYVVPEEEAEAHLVTVNEIMRTPPLWWPELVLYSEGGIATRYGEAK